MVRSNASRSPHRAPSRRNIRRFPLGMMPWRLRTVVGMPWLLALVLGSAWLLWTSQVAAAPTALEIDLRNQVAKAKQYIDDGFCKDAAAITEELTKREDGRLSFDAWFTHIQAHYCLHEIPAALATIDEMQRQMVPSFADQGRLDEFLAHLEANFGKLFVELPRGRTGKVKLTIEVVGALADKSLEPFFQDVKTRFAAGIPVPGDPIYLPRGTYEIDESLVEITSYEGTAFTIGEGRLSPVRRAQSGAGLAFGFGPEVSYGFQGDVATLSQETDAPLTYGGDSRLSSDPVWMMTISTTHLSRWGSLGFVGTRFTFGMHPPLAWAGGVVDGENSTLVPAQYQVGVSLFRRLGSKSAWMAQAGIGAHLRYLAYVRYLVFVQDVLASEADPWQRAAMDVPVFGGGPDLAMEGARTFRVRDGGIQVGAHLGGAFLVAGPLRSFGELEVSGGQGETVEYQIRDEVLWGVCWSFQIFARFTLL